MYPPAVCMLLDSCLLSHTLCCALLQGSSIPSPNAYQAAPKVSSPGLYTPKRAGRLESLKDINDI